METLLANPAFRTYAFCTAILGLKMVFSAVYTGTQRSRTRGFINAEDAATFGPPGATAGDQEHPEVAHALRIQRNDLEAIPIFFAVGLVYVLTGASPFGAKVFCWTFTLARLAHTYCYMHHIQPWRAVSFVVATSATVLMALRVLWTTL
ncbi:MAG: MAPEG family protein [Deltaproteobacteria bacterium]|nr:MAPEG family protein [Deltaproteobacteria bacterium]